MRRMVRLALACALLLSAHAGPALAGSMKSDAARLCQNGGYLSLSGFGHPPPPIGNVTFETAGECIKYAATGGTLFRAMVIPAGATVTFDDPTLSSCNALTWAWGGQGAIAFQPDSKPAGCTTTVGPDVTIGPFSDEVGALFFVALRDDSCGGALFFSNGDHGTETLVGPGEWLVDITDAGPACEFLATPREPTGVGNLRVRVVVTLNR